MTAAERMIRFCERLPRDMRISPALELMLVKEIEAAVEEDRKTRPHEFSGRLDRGCDVCGEPDRDARHLFSRESVRASVEAEREACAKIAIDAAAKDARHMEEVTGLTSEGMRAWEIVREIRARSEGEEAKKK